MLLPVRCVVCGLFAATCLVSDTSAQPLPSDSLRAFGPRTATPTEQPAFRWSDVRHDAWWGPDKAKHVVASFLVTTSAQYVLVSKLGVDERTALPVAAALAAQAGLAKESWDAYRVGGSGFSRRDLVWDAVGIGLGVLLVRW